MGNHSTRFSEDCAQAKDNDPRLTSITIPEASLEYKESKELAEALENNHYVSEIIIPLSSFRFQRKPHPRLFTSLRNLTSLREVRISNKNEWQHTTVLGLFLKAITANKNVKILKLSNVDLSHSASCLHVQHLLEQSCSLETLSIWSPSLPSRSGRLFRTIEPLNSALTAAGCEKIRQGMANTTSLKVLKLHGVMGNHPSLWASILEGLRDNSSVRTLSITELKGRENENYHNSTGMSGLDENSAASMTENQRRLFFDYLQDRSCQLHELKLRGPAIPEPFLIETLIAMRRNRSIRILKIRNFIRLTVKPSAAVVAPTCTVASCLKQLLREDRLNELSLERLVLPGSSRLLINPILDGARRSLNLKTLRVASLIEDVFLIDVNRDADDGTVEQMCQFMHRNKCITSIDFSGKTNLWSKPSTSPIFQSVFMHNNCSLQRLVLADTGFTDGMLLPFGQGLTTASAGSLQWLDLSRNELTAYGCKRLAICLTKRNSPLKTLVLDDNPVGNDAPDSVGQLTLKDARLTNLSMNNTSISVDTIAYIFAAAVGSRNETLKSFAFRGNAGEDSWSTLPAILKVALPRLDQIERIEFSWDPGLSNEICRQIMCDGLEPNTSLLEINVVPPPDREFLEMSRYYMARNRFLHLRESLTDNSVTTLAFTARQLALPILRKAQMLHNRASLQLSLLYLVVNETRHLCGNFEIENDMAWACRSEDRRQDRVRDEASPCGPRSRHKRQRRST